MSAVNVVDLVTRPLRIEYPGADYHVINRPFSRGEVFPASSVCLAMKKRMEKEKRLVVEYAKEKDVL